MAPQDNPSSLDAAGALAGVPAVAPVVVRSDVVPDAPVAPAHWPAVAFVCTRCTGRKGAPKSLDAKQLGRRLREALRDAKLRTRVVHTGCMGLCPRGAMVAAISVRGGPLQIAEPRKKREVAAIVDRMTSKDNAAGSPLPGSSD